jgi:uncharacterized RDD family membrane protein YckC
MSEGPLFGSQFSPAHVRFRYRLWAADLVDLGTAALLGWGAARALDWEQAPLRIVATMLGAWVFLSLVGGVRGWTLGRRLLDVRLVNAEGRPAGLPRSLLRAFTTFPDLVMTPLLPSRPLDRLLGVYGERPAAGLRPWLVGVSLQLPWVASVAAAAWFIATPTRHEAFTFLDQKLTGWKCCHGYRKHVGTWMCRHSLSRLTREVRRQDAAALTLLTECPEAAERLEK